MALQSPAVPSPSSSEAPPPTEVGLIRWMRENLFSSIPNSLLTLFTLYLIYLLARVLIGFFATADWSVVTHNLTLFAIGQYPRSEAWRTLASLILVVVLLIASALFWRSSTTARRFLLTMWFLSPIIITLLLLGFKGSTALPYVRTQLWSGLLLTIMLTVVGITASFPLGILLALGRRSNLPIVKVLSTIYIEVIRGVPLITILFMAQVMLPLFVEQKIDVVIRAMAGITIFSAAYLAEIVRGGLQAIPKGQVEAAEALGLNPPLITSLIVLPQALRIVIPAIVGQFISLFKDTTLVSIITLLDLLGIAESALAQDPAFQFHKPELYLFLAAVYFVFSYAMSSAARGIEARSSRMGGTSLL